MLNKFEFNNFVSRPTECIDLHYNRHNFEAKDFEKAFIFFFF